MCKYAVIMSVHVQRIIVNHMCAIWLRLCVFVHRNGFQFEFGTFWHQVTAKLTEVRLTDLGLDATPQLGKGQLRTSRPY